MTGLVASASWSRPRRGFRWLLGFGVVVAVVGVFFVGSWFSGSLLVERQERRWATELGPLDEWPASLDDRETNEAAMRLGRSAARLGLRVSRRFPPSPGITYPTDLIDARLREITALTVLDVAELTPLDPGLEAYLDEQSRPILATTQALLRSKGGLTWGLERSELLLFRAREVDRAGLVALHDLLVVACVEDERERDGGDGRRRFEAVSRLRASLAPVGERDVTALVHMLRSEAALARLLQELPRELAIETSTLRIHAAEAMAMRASILHDILLDAGAWQRALPMLEQLEEPEALSRFKGEGLTRESFRAHRASTMMLLTRRRIHALLGTESQDEARDSGPFAPRLDDDAPTPRVLRAPSLAELSTLQESLTNLDQELRLSACAQRLRASRRSSGKWPSAEEVWSWDLLHPPGSFTYGVTAQDEALLEFRTEERDPPDQALVSLVLPH